MLIIDGLGVPERVALPMRASYSIIMSDMGPSSKISAARKAGLKILSARHKGNGMSKCYK